ncbi:MAG TPA: FG-GAP-like repeat-containing protein [Candidatus Solibacter sp.]|nr:FG-GAP-like repeat-containing protein [Candidatus Solibacter sp.]
MRRVALRRATLVAVCGLMLCSFAAAASFKGPSTFGAHLAPDSVVVADFNGDGFLDIAIANRSSNDISVLLGKGNGTFNTQVKYAAGTGGPDPASIAAADLNGDGKPDLVVADSGTNKVSVLLNTGTGTFNAAVQYTVGTTPSSVAVGDLNGDGVADIAVTNSGSNTVQVLINNGAGTFSNGGSFATGASPSSVAIADFDGVNGNDLVVTNQNGNSVSVLLNNGSGTFAAAQTYCVVTTSGSCTSVGAVSPVSVVAIDLTGDGKADLAVASLGASVATLVNNGSGVFTLTAQASSSQTPQSIAAGVFVTSANPALVVADNTTNSFEIYGTTTGGNLNTPLSYISGNKPSAIAVGDFNGDHKLDVAVVNNTDDNVAVILGNGDGTFSDMQNFISGGNVRSVAVGDFNGDAKIDFLANTSIGTTYNVNLFTGNGKGAFTAVASVNFSSDVNSIAVSDFNVDKKLDFVVAHQSSNTVSVVPGNGNATFNTASNYATDSGPVSVAVGDFNHDGFPDIVTANSGGSDVSVLLNTKTGSFNAAVNYPAGTSPSAVAVGDVNDDGFPDIVVANSGSGNVSVLLGKGDGTFQAAVTYNVGNGPAGIALAELDGDLFLDIMVTNKADNSVAVLLNNGDGTFQAATAYTIPNSSPVGVIAADITADGILDLVVTESGTNSVGVLPGNGDGTFGGALNYKIGVAPVAVATADLSGDGKFDLLVGDSTGGDVTELINQNPAAVMSATPAKLTFGNVQVGSTTAPQTVTLTNKGNTTLNIASITTSADYNMTTTCGSTLASLGSCTITISLSPTFPGAINGILTIKGNVTGGYLLVPITGTGQFPMAVSPVTLTFPSTAVGNTSAGQTVTVINQSPVTQNFTFSATGNYNVAGSGTTPCGSSLAGGAKCTVSVSLSPTQSGAISGSFIVSGTNFMPQITSLSGTGTGGPTLPLTFSPVNLLFDSPALGFSSLPKTVTATNTTGGTLNLTLTASTDWSVSGTGTKPCGGALAAGASCTFAVVFTPSILGYFNGSISVATGSGNPIIYDLEGLGNLASSFSPGSMNFGTVPVGTTSAGQIVKVWNFENTNMTVLGWSASGDYSAVPGGTQPCAINGQVPPLLKPFCNLVVYFTPRKTGTISGAITVTTGWSTGSTSFPVTGVGQ